MSVQTFYVGESIAELVAAANVGSTTQLQATVLEINKDPQVPGGVQYSFPANEIVIGENIDYALPDVKSYIQFKGVRYSVFEVQADLLVSGNGASAYKVYTALLTQSGGDGISYIENFSTSGVQNIIKGVTYRIDVNSDNVDFSSIGAPSNAAGTYFVATANAVNTDFLDFTWALEYNTGAPVATVLENTIGNIWFTYYGLGDYFINSNGLFINEKTFALIGTTGFSTGGGDTGASIMLTNPPNNVEVTALNGDDALASTPIEIRVYN